MDTLQAAILLPKLEIFADEIIKRNLVATSYTRLLNDVGIVSTPYVDERCISSWAQYTILVEDREDVLDKLKEAGVPTAVHYPIPLNKQPAVKDDAVSLPIGDEVAKQVMSLPMHPYLSTQDQKIIVTAF